MGNAQISAIRSDDFIDVYVTQNDGNLKHYWANNFTGWIYHNEIIWKSVYEKPAVIRFGNSIDIYVLTQSRTLVHMWSGDYTNWQYNNGVLAEGISSPPVVVRWENDIDVYCFNNDGVLLHFHASEGTNWQYERKEIYHSSNHSNLFALRTKREAIDLYLLESGHITHIHIGDHNGWVYANERILEDIHVPNGNIAATRTDNCINLFYCDEAGHVCHGVSADFTGWRYQNRGPISFSTTARNKMFSVVQHEDNVDVYFIGNDNCVHHCYNGVYSNYTWNSDDIISSSDATSGIAAVRPYQKAIDVYYLGKDDQLKHLFIGEGTNNNWSTYQYDFSAPILHWEDLKDFATIIGEGFHGKVYLIQKNSEKFVVKKFKVPNTFAIRSEMNILDKLSSIWSNLCQAQIFENGNLVGFAMAYIQGQKLDQILQDKDNIFHQSASARVQLIKKLGSYMHQVQKLGICHGDLSLDNIMVYQKNKHSKSDITITILDFGNGFLFDSNTRTQAILTGWKCLKPPETKLGQPYDPTGVNAYQMARVAIQILLLTPFSTYRNISSNPNDELEKLEKLGYAKSLVDFLAKGVHADIKKRIAILNEIVSTAILNSFNDDSVNNNISSSISESIKRKIKESKLPEPAKNDSKHQNTYEMVYDFLRKHVNVEVEWTAVEGDNYALLYASAGVSIEDNIFITVNIEAKAGLFRIISDSGSNITKVDFEVLKAQVGVTLGSYNGFELYVALVEGKVSVFDIKIGVGADSGIGINQDSYEEKLFGTGFFVGRRVGISVFGSEFAIDFKRFFSDEQWNTIRPIIHSVLQIAFPQAFVLGEVGKLISNFSRDGRAIEMIIENYTLHHFTFHDRYFDCGTIDKNYSESIRRGNNTEFSVCKKVGFYGVEGTVIYRVKELKKNFAFSFFNPYRGGNKIMCQVYVSEEPTSDAKTIHYAAESRKKSSDETYIDDDEDSDFRLIYLINSGNNSKALFRVISRKLILD